MHHHIALLRFARTRPRLAIALAPGLRAAVVVPEIQPPVTRLLIGWNAAVWSWLVLLGWLRLRASPARVRAIAEREDPSAVLVPALLSITAIASLAAIVATDLTFDQRPLHYAFAGSTLFGSWLMLNTLFKFHHAYIFTGRRPRSLCCAFRGIR